MLGNDVLYKGKKVLYANQLYRIEKIKGINLKLRSVRDENLAVECSLTSRLIKSYYPGEE